MQKEWKLALCQMHVTADAQENLERALEMLGKARDAGAKLAVLPEMFCCPYDSSLFAPFSLQLEKMDVTGRISRMAAQTGMAVVAGSLPEREGGMLYNTSFVFDGTGEKIARHRKIHLFDVDFPGRLRFCESDVLSAGEDVTVFRLDGVKIGLAICFDMRFPELSLKMALEGARLLLFPAAFNPVTGPAHWELLLRARAVDSQCFAAAVSPASDSRASYVAYGHSMLADPWGGVLGQCGGGEELLIENLDWPQVDRVRRELPVLKSRRPGLYV